MSTDPFQNLGKMRDVRKVEEQRARDHEQAKIHAADKLASELKDSAEDLRQRVILCIAQIASRVPYGFTYKAGQVSRHSDTGEFVFNLQLDENGVGTLQEITFGLERPNVYAIYSGFYGNYGLMAVNEEGNKSIIKAIEDMATNAATATPASSFDPYSDVR